MRAWYARKNGVANGDNDPLLDIAPTAQNVSNDETKNDGSNKNNTAVDSNFHELKGNADNNDNDNDKNDGLDEPTPAQRRAMHRRKILESKRRFEENGNNSESNTRASSLSLHVTNSNQENNNSNDNIGLLTIGGNMSIVIESEFGQYGGLPEDLFIYVLTFLNESDKCWCAQVSPPWRDIVYQPILWQSLDLSRHYAHGAHDFLLKHILTKCSNRFNELIYINLENCIALTDRSLVFITENCPTLKVLLLTNCYKLNPKTILECVRKLPFLLKIELFGVISDKNKYYFQQQLQQLTYFINEIANTRQNEESSPNGNSRSQSFNNNNNNNNNNNGLNNFSVRRGSPNVRNRALNVGLMDAAAQAALQQEQAPRRRQRGGNGGGNENDNEDDDDNNNGNNNNRNNNNDIGIGNRDDNEDNARRGAAAPLEAEGDNRRRVERIQRIEIMGLLAQSIKQSRPWIDLGLFWLQLLSIVGMNDPCMILDRDEYNQLYPAIEDEFGITDSSLPFEYLQYRRRVGKYPFYGARIVTIPEWILYSMKQEIAERNENERNALAAAIAASSSSSSSSPLRNNNNNNNNSLLNDNDDEKKANEPLLMSSGPAAGPANENNVSISMQSPQTKTRRRDSNIYQAIENTSDTMDNSSANATPRKKNNNNNNDNDDNDGTRNNDDLIRKNIEIFEPNFELAADHEWMLQSNAKMTSDMNREKRKKPGLFGDGSYVPFDNNNNNNDNDNDKDIRGLDDDDDDNNDTNKKKRKSENEDDDDMGIVGVSSHRISKSEKANNNNNNNNNNSRVNEIEEIDIFHEENENDLYNIESEYTSDNVQDRFAMKQLPIELLQKYFKDKYRRLLPPPLVPAKCRYQGRFQGGCWGRVKGRLVYSNQYYSQGGNFPNEILYSCDAHSNEDLVDERFHLCRNCEKLFRLESMYGEVSCKVCHDTAILQEKTNWIQLTKKSISKQFNFSHVCGNTLNVADRRNLPKTLKSFGKVYASLTYNIIFEQHEAQMREENDNKENNNNNDNGNDNNDDNDNDMGNHSFSNIINNNNNEAANNNDAMTVARVAQERQRIRQRQRERERIQHLRRRQRHARQQQRSRRRRRLARNNNNNNNNNNGQNGNNENNGNDNNNNNNNNEEKNDDAWMDEEYDSDMSDDSDGSSTDNDLLNNENNNNNNNNNNNVNNDVPNRNNNDEINPNHVAISDFWHSNHQRVATVVDKLKGKLRKAMKKEKTRAILVYSEHNSKKIEVLADDGVLFDGPEGDDYVFLTISAWTQFYNILLPVLICVLTTIIFIYELDYYDEEAQYSGSSSTSNAIYLPDAPETTQDKSIYLYVGLAAIIILVIGACLAYKFQRQCEKIFRLFLVFDIFLILSIGCAILLFVVFYNYNWTIDSITFCLFVWNFGFLGTLSFYQNVPPFMHRMFLIILNSIMSIMITSAIGWYVLFLLLLLVIADTVAMLKRNFGRMFSPFLVPTNIPLPNTTPRIFYTVYGLRVRAPEFMFYGLMVGLADIEYLELAVIVFLIMGGFVISVFVGPFFSYQLRPLPICFAILAIGLVWYDQIFDDYITKEGWNLVFP